MEQNKLEEQEPVEEVEDNDMPWYGVVICIAGIICALIGFAVSLDWLLNGDSSEIGSTEVKTESGEKFDLYDMERAIDDLEENGRVDCATMQAIINHLALKERCRIHEERKKAQIKEGCITY